MLFSTFYMCNLLNFYSPFKAQLQCPSPPPFCPDSSPPEPGVLWTQTSLHLPLKFHHHEVFGFFN